MTSPFRGGELWGDGAGGAAALTLAYVAGTEVLLDKSCDLLLYITTPGTAPTSIEIDAQVQVRGTWVTIPIQYPDEDGIRQVADAVYQVEGAGPELFRIVAPHDVWFRVRAKRTGGGVDTTALVVAEVREPTGGPHEFPNQPGSSGQSYVPYDGGGQAINVGAAATRTTQLTTGERYEVVAEAPCYWTWGDNAVAATTADAYLPAGAFKVVTIPDAAHSYITCIRQTTNATGGFHVSRVS